MISSFLLRQTSNLRIYLQICLSGLKIKPEQLLNNNTLQQVQKMCFSTVKMVIAWRAKILVCKYIYQPFRLTIKSKMSLLNPKKLLDNSKNYSQTVLQMIFDPKTDQSYTLYRPKCVFKSKFCRLYINFTSSKQTYKLVFKG